MKFLKDLLSDETFNELNEKLGDDLVKQVDEKLGNFKVSAGKEKLIPKAVFDTEKAELKKQLEQRDTQLNELLGKVKDNDSLTLQIKEMKEANDKITADYEAKLKAQSQTYAYEKALADFKPKNLKALDGVIDKSKIVYKDENGEIKIDGLSEQIDALKQSDAYLFEGNSQSAPNPQNSNNFNKSKEVDTDLLDAFGLEAEK